MQEVSKISSVSSVAMVITIVSKTFTQRLNHFRTKNSEADLPKLITVDVQLCINTKNCTAVYFEYMGRTI